MTVMWRDLGHPEITPELKQKIIDGVLEEADGHSIDELEAERDAMVLGLEAVRAKYGALGKHPEVMT
jgi:hypothetical protein